VETTVRSVQDCGATTPFRYAKQMPSRMWLSSERTMNEEQQLSYRTSAGELKQRAADLRDVVSDGYFKELLTTAILDIEDIETFLFSAERNTSSDLWLHVATMHLQVAKTIINGVQSAVERFGYDATVGADISTFSLRYRRAQRPRLR
jgi:hypothetical protein